MATKNKQPEPDVEFVPAPELEAKAQQPDEDKMVRPAEDKADVRDEVHAAVKKAGWKPRWAWEATGADSKTAEHFGWRVRVAQLGATGLWRPFVEYIGDDYKTEQAAEKALERLLR